jgi:hypothetical protein
MVVLMVVPLNEGQAETACVFRLSQSDPVNQDGISNGQTLRQGVEVHLNNRICLGPSPQRPDHLDFWTKQGNRAVKMTRNSPRFTDHL